LDWLTSLGRTEVFARCRSSRTSTASLFNAQSATFDNFTLQSLLRSISLVRSDHLDEAEATRFFGMRIQHDRAAFDLAVFVEEARNVGFGETRMYASDEEVRASIDCAFILSVLHAGIGGWWRTGKTLARLIENIL
jgi:hypothetical protein